MEFSITLDTVKSGWFITYTIAIKLSVFLNDPDIHTEK